MDLLDGSVSVANGDENASVAQRCNVVRRFIEVRRQCDPFDEIAGGLLPAVEFGDRWWTNVFAQMRAARAIFRGEVRSFNVYTGNHVLEGGLSWRAVAIARGQATIFSSDAVMIVGRKVVTPVASTL